MLGRDGDVERASWVVWWRRAIDGEGMRSKFTSCLESLESPFSLCDHLDRKLYSWQTRLDCELLVFRVLGSLSRDSFFPLTPMASSPYPKVSTLKSGPSLSLPADSSSLSLFIRFLPLVFSPGCFSLRTTRPTVKGKVGN